MAFYYILFFIYLLLFLFSYYFIFENHFKSFLFYIFLKKVHSLAAVLHEVQARCEVSEVRGLLLLFSFIILFYF